MPGNASRTPFRWLDPHFIPMVETCQLQRSGGNTGLSSDAVWAKGLLYNGSQIVTLTRTPNQRPYTCPIWKVRIGIRLAVWYVGLAAIGATANKNTARYRRLKTVEKKGFFTHGYCRDGSSVNVGRRSVLSLHSARPRNSSQ